MSGGIPDLATRMNAIGESSTTRIFRQAQQLRLQGMDIISLAVGEPDFDTPEPIIAATRDALTAQETRYGPIPGIDTLRTLLAQQFDPCDPENIIVTNGAKQALFSLFHVLCDRGDEIILPRPCWVSFTEQIKLAGGSPVLVETKPNHQLDVDAIQEAITTKTKAILVNTPNNPTGAVYPRQDLQAVAQIAHHHGLYLVVDEAYHAFTYGGAGHVSMTELTENPQRVITIRSFSKQYNMTGYRLGYAVASRDVIAAMSIQQSHLCGNVCSFAQHGALAALEMDPAIVENRRKTLEQRCQMAFGLAADLFDCIQPKGAFYLFPSVVRHLKTGESSEVFAMRLLHQCGVAVVPGEAFGGPGHIRISFGAEASDIKEAFERIKKAL